MTWRSRINRAVLKWVFDRLAGAHLRAMREETEMREQLVDCLDGEGHVVAKMPGTPDQ